MCRKEMTLRRNFQKLRESPGVRYQTADLGIAPYDYLSLGLRDYTHFQYFGCRVFTDAFCALLCWLLGGLVGLGTLICAFCLGPFIQFFNGLVSERVLQYKPEKA